MLSQIAYEAYSTHTSPQDEYWNAVMSHDVQADGKFVYAVRSTRVYCRPSCPSRRPGREQVRFFLSILNAEREGFRECKRCRPKLFEDRKRLAGELQIASEIQSRLQPGILEGLDGWEIQCYSEPCYEVGGDYHDVIRNKRDHRIVISLGDVSGKGIGAALLMSSMHASVRAQSRNRTSLPELMNDLNDYIYENTPPNKYASLFYSELDLSTGTLNYCNAGHYPPILVSKTNPARLLSGSGFPLGMLAGAHYSEHSITLADGDVLLIYTDGVTERSNVADAEFGVNRLMETLSQSSGDSAQVIDQKLRSAITHFADGLPLKDDISWIVMKRTDFKS
jgi:sigma-B regulation protein RsbU (phosphoserine phosphatase)